MSLGNRGPYHTVSVPLQPHLQPSSFLIPLLNDRSPGPSHAIVFLCPLHVPHSSLPLWHRSYYNNSKLKKMHLDLVACEILESC